MKIAIFTGNYNHIRDGVSLTLNRLVDFLEKQGVEVMVLGPTTTPPALEHKGYFLSVPSLPLPGRPEYRFSRSLPASAREELEQFDPDLVHIATPDLLGLLALRWALKKRKPIVSSYHTHFSSYLKYYRLTLLEPLLWRYLKWFYKKCEQVYVPSESMAEVLQEKGIVSDLKIWARGIDQSLFSPEKRDLSWRAELGFSETDVVVAFVSRLVWEKNLQFYADVVNELREKHPQIKALVVGDGPAMDGLKKLLYEGIFTGFLTGAELARAYASSDIFFFPSDTETFGNVTLEAMSSGLPCVVANAAGSRSLVENGKSGFVIPIEEKKRYCDAISQLISDSELRSQMALEAQKRSLKYSWEAVNEALISYYRVVLHKTK